ncbi:MAG: STM4014 family protein [Deltaproteobacteria bacterium]|nr:STM4014 family protein [Deltaproteobacteria bacterium]
MGARTELAWILVGNPDNRRIVGFREALATRGQPELAVLSHEQLLSDPSALLALPDEPATVRIDSVGESTQVEQALLEWGYEARAAEGVEPTRPRLVEHGEVLAPRQQHLGFLRYLGALSLVFRARPSWRLMVSPASIALSFDKSRACAAYRALGVPVPEAFEVPTESVLRSRSTRDGLIELMRGREVEQVFVKLRSGSSASCLCALSARGYGMTTLERSGERWYNSLRVRRVEGEKLEAVLAFLVGEGAHVERAERKARLAGAYFDCRVLMIANEPAFTVVRQSRHPITNLHLGGWRGDVELLRERLGPGAWDRAMESCLRVMEYHAAFHLGLDVMFETDFSRHRIIESNAFGDLIPNSRRDGRTVYEWEIEEWVRLSG